METIERWICVMIIVCPRLLDNDQIREQWRVLMSRRYALPLFRDIVEKLHELMTEAIQSATTISKENKRQYERDIRNSQTVAVNEAPSHHKRARLFLRKSLRSNYLILSDVPGLLGLKTQLALMIMSSARDEILWLVAHCTTEAPIRRQGKDGSSPHQDLKEPHLAEMLYYIEQLRVLMKKYHQVLVVYHGSVIKRSNDELAQTMEVRYSILNSVTLNPVYNHFRVW